MRTLTFILLALLISGTACTQTAGSQTAEGNGPTLSVEEFQAAITKGEALLVDVRTAPEYNSGHIPGSVNVDWTAHDYEARFAGLDPQRPLLIYCAVGGRSDQARAYLQGKGYTVQELDEGIAAWKQAGLPLER